MQRDVAGGRPGIFERRYRVPEMIRMARACILVLLATTATLVHPQAEAAVRVSMCQGQPGCICIDWDRGFSSWLEVRCPSGGGDSGWTRNPDGIPIDVPDGGWRGPGGDQPSDQPGNPLKPEQLFKWNQAKTEAFARLRGTRNCCINGKPYYTRTSAPNSSWATRWAEWEQTWCRTTLSRVAETVSGLPTARFLAILVESPSGPPVANMTPTSSCATRSSTRRSTCRQH